MFQGYKGKGLWWFRVFGVGLHFKDVRSHPPMVSERMGGRRKLHVGPYRLGLLRRVTH